MKTYRLIAIAACAFIISACVAPSYYQVYKVAPESEMSVTENALIYEDEHCTITYNLWEEGGNMGFLFHNKTNESIYLNKEKSFFILNGIAYDYYLNRVYTKSAGTEVSLYQTPVVSYFTQNTNGISANRSYAVSRQEEKIVAIPSQTSKMVLEYKINQEFIDDCDLQPFPTSRKIKTKSYTKADSPLTFSNRLAYTVGTSEELIQFENEFYISELTNYPSSKMFDYVYLVECGVENESSDRVMINTGPNKFYMKYKRNY